MEKSPKVSIIIPCYNDGFYLRELLTKIHDQSFKNYEIIIVDDGSTDQLTADILHVLASEGVIIFHKENGRMSSARNYGVLHAQGDYILTVDADDYFESTFLEKALNEFDNDSSIGVVSSYLKLFGELNSKSRPRGGSQYNFLFSNECSSCALIRKSLWDDVGGYDENMKLGYEDWEFYIRITQKGWTVKIIPEYLIYYRQTKKSNRLNYTEPNRLEIIKYITNKHSKWYIDCIIYLMNEKSIIYTKRRTSYSLIIQFLYDRLTFKYK